MNPGITLGDCLLISGLLFAIGLGGVLLRRNLVIVLMSIELMLNAANLALVSFARFRPVGGACHPDAQILVFFVISVAAAEVAIGLAILVALFRARLSLRTDDLRTMKF
jgi:NADH-quinone oxidoreductase subunit K